MMTINHVISSIDITTGGPARSVTQLIEEMLSLSNNVSICLNTLESLSPIINNFDSKGKGVIKFNSANTLDYSKSLTSSLNISESDIFHGHGLWQMPVHQMAKIARKRQIPYVITPRGMLEPWSLTQSPFKKKVALSLFQRNDLRNATCIHTTAPMEMRSIRNLGFKNPIAMIPNGIDLKSFSSVVPQKRNAPKRILFLSRIHKKKGVENLIEAWKQLPNSVKTGWIIDIYGNGEGNYIEELKSVISAAGLEKQINIYPPVFGENKQKVFRQASLFVLPTYSENFGIVVAEALASYTPVITTKGAPWEDLDTFNCGKWIDVGIEPLNMSLSFMLKKTSSELLEMGVNGRSLVEKKYGMQAVAKQMLELYDWILNKEQKPSFIDVL